jgi:hypothetical protein
MLEPVPVSTSVCQSGSVKHQPQKRDVTDRIAVMSTLASGPTSAA